MRVLLAIISGLCLAPCVLSADYWPGISCHTTGECGPDTGMLCNMNEKKCLCPTADGFDYSEKKCLLTSGTPCTVAPPVQELTPHSFCNASTLSVQCDPGYPVTSNKKCAKTINQTCAASSDCDRDLFLTCLSSSSTCGCPEGSQFLNGKCILNSRQDCAEETNPGPPLIACPSHLVCTQDPDSNETKNICICGNDLEENSNGVCVLGYNGRCNVTGTPSGPCDDTAFLVCDNSFTNGRCRCENPDVTEYDKDAKVCRLFAGQKCVEGQGQGQQPCAKFSDCKDDDASGESICTCSDGLIEYNGNCFLHFGEPCGANGSAPCHGHAYMQCGDKGECECAYGDEAAYNVTAEICEKLPGTSCSTTPGNQPCAENSQCSGATYKCECIGDLDLGYRKCHVAYGDKCDETDKSRPTCNNDAHIMCLDGKCACADSPDIWYENTTRACVLLEGASCTEDESDPDCTSFSLCDDVSGKCQCITNHTVTAERTCAGLLGAPCGKTNTAPCNAEDFLKCHATTYTCSCDDYWNGDGWFNPDTQKCDLLERSYCKNGTNEQKCKDFSVCAFDSNSEQRCACVEDLYGTVEHECVVPFGHKCGTPDRPRCHEEYFQTCAEGKCVCAGNPGEAWYDQANIMCVLNPGMPCDRSDYLNQPCGHFTECVTDEGEEYKGHCVCGQRFVEHEGQCYSNYGGSCAYSNASYTLAPCLPGKFFECTSWSSECICMGENLGWYDETNEICKLLPGAPCLAGPQNQQCVEFSSCTKITGKSSICACDEGLIISKEGQCVVPYNGNCKSADGPPCNEFDFEFCSSAGKCSCEENEDVWYDASNKTCVLLTGAECSFDPQKNPQPCVQSAECIEDPEWKDTYLCACTNGVENPKDRKCIAVYGETCGQPGDAFCSTDEFLECISGKCACAGGDNVIYDPISNTCRLLPGARCSDEGKSQGCAGFSNCTYSYEQGFQLCACDEGLIQTSKRECALPYGESCSASLTPPCNDEAHHVCDSSGTCACASADLIPFLNENCVRKYGAPCNVAGLIGVCNTDGHQMCIANNTCACADTQNMKYNSTDLTCYLKMGAACTSSNVSCDFQLACAASGTCHCDPELGLSHDGNGACARRINQPCSDGDKCNKYEFLTCLNGYCACDANYNYYNESCVGHYKASCRTHAQCNFEQSLVCNEKMECDCADALKNVYYEDLSACYSTVGGDCHVTELAGNWSGSGTVPLKCHPNLSSWCTAVGNENIGVCSCPEGVTADKNGVCLNHGVSLNSRYDVLILAIVSLVWKFLF